MIKKFRHKIGKKRAEEVVARILPFLKNSQNIIDIGCGTGYIATLLQEKGKDVTAVDVVDKTLYPSSDPARRFPHLGGEISRHPRGVPRRATKVLIYDGKSLPFPDAHFDTSLLLTVLHHTSDPGAIFSEAARVGKELVVIETLHKDLLGKLFIVLFDSLINRQPRFYWNSYKTDKEWKNFFEDRGFEVVASQYHRDRVFGMPYFHGVYYLKRA